MKAASEVIVTWSKKQLRRSNIQQDLTFECHFLKRYYYKEQDEGEIIPYRLREKWILQIDPTKISATDYSWQLNLRLLGLKKLLHYRREFTLLRRSVSIEGTRVIAVEIKRQSQFQSYFLSQTTTNIRGWEGPTHKYAWVKLKNYLRVLIFRFSFSFSHQVGGFFHQLIFHIISIIFSTQNQWQLRSSGFTTLHYCPGLQLVIRSQ